MFEVSSDGRRQFFLFYRVARGQVHMSKDLALKPKGSYENSLSV